MKEGKGNPNTRPLPPLSADDIDRFRSLVTKGGDDECWPWKLKPVTGGYGMFSVSGDSFRANRVALFLDTGVDRVDRMACHKCNNPICCKPRHIYAGTGQDNADDRIAAGTVPRGEEHSRHILTEADVRQIQIDLWVRRIPQRAVAKKFNVSRRTIDAIHRGESWIHLQ